MNHVRFLFTVLLCLIAARVAGAAPSPTTEPARAIIKYPDYSSPRRAVETFIWAVKAHDSAKISACLYGHTRLDESAVHAFANMTAAMGSMLAKAKQRLGPPPGHKHGRSVNAQLDALKMALVHSTVSIKGNHAVISFAQEKEKTLTHSLHLIRHGTDWKLNIQYMLHLRQARLTQKLIRSRIADEQTFADLLRAMTADLDSGKIKTWRQFTVEFESRMLAEAARKEARKEAARKSSR